MGSPRFVCTGDIIAYFWGKCKCFFDFKLQFSGVFETRYAKRNRYVTGAHIGAPLPPIYYDVPIKFYRGRGAPACAPANEKNVTFCPSNTPINPNLPSVANFPLTSLWFRAILLVTIEISCVTATIRPDPTWHFLSLAVECDSVKLSS